MPDITKTCEHCLTAFKIKRSYSDYQERHGAPVRFCSKLCFAESKKARRGVSAVLEFSIPEPNSGCWLWLGSMFNNGYGRIGCPPASAHRMSYKAFNGDIPPGMVVRHSCDNKSCVNPDHLLIGTLADNVQDKVDRNRQAKGSRIARAVLKEGDVSEIKNLIRAGRMLTRIADKFGVSAYAIKCIKHGRTWRHIQ